MFLSVRFTKLFSISIQLTKSSSVLIFVGSVRTAEEIIGTLETAVIVKADNNAKILLFFIKNDLLILLYNYYLNNKILIYVHLIIILFQTFKIS